MNEQQKFTDSQQVEQAALLTIDTFYGIDYYAEGPLPQRRRYHNGFHTRNVKSDFAVLAEAFDLTDTECLIGNLACTCHDLVIGSGSGPDEEASADWLVRQLEVIYPERLQIMARLAILGTQPVMEGPLMTDQMASRLDYPSKRHELVAKLVACADLGKLYSPMGPTIAHHLHHEFIGSNSPDDDAFEKLLGFQRIQPAFLDTYHYPLPQAEHILGTHKTAVRNYAEDLIRQLEKGDIKDWRQVLAHDNKFLKQFI